MMRFILFAALALTLSGPLAAAPIEARISRAADGTHTLEHEAVVDAPPAAVWQAISTVEGWKKWAVPVAWMSSRDPVTIETSYDPAAKPDGPQTIKQVFLRQVPGKLLAFRTIKAPDGFVGFETFTKVVHTFELTPLAGSRTRVRLSGAGFADDETGNKLLEFFAKGNAISLEKLVDLFARNGKRD